MKLLISTRNRHKLKEIRAIMKIPNLDLLCMDNFSDIPEIEEDGDSFKANAKKKAVTLALKTGLWTIADDSGLEVYALDYAPGIYSARYAGEPADYQENNIKLLHELEDIDDRSARFKCVMALSTPEGKVQFIEGKCEGTITTKPRGTNGFGYDPVFIPQGYDRTFAELDSNLKNSISHRARALEEAKKEWLTALTYM